MILHTCFIVLILYENRIVCSEPFLLQEDAKVRAVELSAEWYHQDGIEAFGKEVLESYYEMQAYFHSDAYLDSGDTVHICIEEVVLERS